MAVIHRYRSHRSLAEIELDHDFARLFGNLAAQERRLSVLDEHIRATRAEARTLPDCSLGHRAA